MVVRALYFFLRSRRLSRPGLHHLDRRLSLEYDQTCFEQRNLLVDNILDEIEGKGEDHGGVLFRANAVQSLGGEMIRTLLHNFLFNVIHR